MPRYALLLTLFIAVVNSLNGQEANKFKFGLFAAPSINWLNVKSNSVDSRGTTLNVNYGLFADFALNGNQRYFVSSGLQVTSLGGRYFYKGAFADNGSVYASNNEVELVTRYIEVPLAIKMRSNEIGYSIIGGYAGIGTGFRVNGYQNRTVTYTGATGEVSKDFNKENVQDDLNPMRFALIFGIELERKITKNTYFTMGATFNNGLSNIFNSKVYELNDGGSTDLKQVDSDGKSTGSEVLKASNKAVALHFGIYF